MSKFDRASQSLLMIVLAVICVAALTWHRRVTPAAPVSRAASLRSTDQGMLGAASSNSLVASPAWPQALTPLESKRAQAAYAKLPIRFEAAEGQIDSQVKFRARGIGYQLWLTSTEAALQLQITNREMPQPRSLSIKTPETLSENDSSPSAVLRIKPVGVNPRPIIEGLNPLPGESNYFLGKEPERWRTNIKNYAKVQYRDVYPGVNLIYYGNQQQLEYDFIIAPGANPNLIKLAFTGAEQILVDAGGELVLRTKGGELRQRKPIIYQEVAGQKHEIAGRYILTDKLQVGFQVGDYDPGQPLIIDPIFSYSTYLGGNFEEGITYLTADAEGNVYFIGETQSTDFPVVNPAQPNKNERPPLICTLIGGCTDAFVGKMNAAGTALIYATYLGGYYNDTGFGIAVDAAGNAYLTGFTQSNDFPITPGAFQPDRRGNSFGQRDSFVAKLSAGGSTLIYSTYLGGIGSDRAFGIAVDQDGNAYVAGRTDSDDFPTVHPYRAAKGGFDDVDGFIAKLSADGSELLFSTYFGGSDDDTVNAIAVDAGGNIYVVGAAVSDDLPTTPGAYQRKHGGSDDVFVAKFSSDGSKLIFSTYVGGSGGDVGLSLALDAANNIYVTGFSGSFDGSFTFPLVNPLQRESTYLPGLGVAIDVIIFKLSADGSNLLYSTYLGGGLDENSNGNITVDATGKLYLSGRTASPDFPVTPDALQPVYGGGFYDAFVAVIDPSRTGWDALRYSSYLGGSANDEGQSTAIDAQGNMYVAGVTSTHEPPNTFPIVNAFQATASGTGDGFISKLSFPVSSTATDQTPPTVTITTPTTASDYISTSPSITVSGTASDNVGVTQVYWRKEQGEADLDIGLTWGIAQGTANWTVKEIILQTGINRVIITARDAAGNFSSSTLTIHYQPEYIINTFAGGGASLNEGIPATQLAFQGEPIAVATDQMGNVYFSGTPYGVVNNMRAVWKVDSAGIVTRVAGNGQPGVSGDNGPATQATLNTPYALALDRAGKIYIADDATGLVRKVSTNGTISTIAGDKNSIGFSGFSGDGGPATAAKFGNIRGVAVDAVGQVYISDSGNNRIRKIDLNGIVTTIAGTGDNGYSGDGGPATQATLSAPHGLAFDADGNLYLAEPGNGRVRRISRDGIITTVAGGGNNYPGDGGAATDAQVATPIGVAFDRAGNLIIGGPDGDQVRRVTPAGIIDTIAGMGEPGYSGDGGAANIARLSGVVGVATGAQGQIYLADSGNLRIRLLTPTSPGDRRAPTISISTPTTAASYNSNQPFIALSGTASDDSGVTQIKWSNDRGGSGIANGTSNWRADRVSLQSGLNNITVTAKDTAGNINSSTLAVTYTLDTIAPTVTFTAPTSGHTYTASAIEINLSGTASDNAGITGIRWQDEYGNSGQADGTVSWTIHNYKLHAGQNHLTVQAEDTAGNVGTATMIITYQPEYLIYTIAGPGVYASLEPFTDGGPAYRAVIYSPQVVAVDAVGNVYIGEAGSNIIRKIALDGTIHLLAGGPKPIVEGMLAIEAEIGEPQGLALDAAGNIYFSDSNHQCVRKITADGRLFTIAGTGKQGFSGDGGAATQAQLNYPAGIALDATGNLYVADVGNNRIRKVTPGGIITTIAGVGGQGASNLGDGGPAIAAQLGFPISLACDQAGNIYLADTDNYRIRKIAANGIITTVAGSASFGGFSGDGGPATSALLNAPRGVAVDAAGNLYFSDSDNGCIRQVNTAGIITTIAGFRPGEISPIYRTSGVAATSVRLLSPRGLAVDRYGTIYFAEHDDNLIRKLTRFNLNPPPTTSVSAASYHLDAVARESIVAAFGANLATTAQAAAALPLPIILGGTRVLVRDSVGVERPAALFYVSPTQVNYQIPSGTNSGLATVTIVNSNGDSSVGTVTVAATTPGLFTVTSDGQGPAAAIAVHVKPSGEQFFELIADLDPATNKYVSRPIDLGPENEIVVLELFGTGLRYRSSLSNVTATIGGVAAQVDYAGAQPDFVGLDQINVRLPRSLIGRGEADLVLTVDGKAANAVKVNIK